MNAMPFVDKRGRVYTYGEFFPMEHALFGYNISLVNEHFPLTKEEAEKEGYWWQEVKKPDNKSTLLPKDIPDAIEDVSDSITREILECMQCKKAYRIIPMELAFLKSVKIPIPRFCNDCRHRERIAQRAKPFLYHRECECNGATSLHGVYTNLGKHFHGTAACSNEFETSHDKSRPEIIYCLECFWQEVA